MTETTDNLEQFIAKLKQEGVEAGRVAGEKVKEEATVEAEKIIAEAKREAEDILKNAEEKAKQTLEQGKTELSLAARDVLLLLRDRVQKVVSRVLQGYCENKLSDSYFLGELIKGVVFQYVQADLKGEKSTVFVQEELLSTLRDSILAELSKDAGVGFVGGLREAGFNFTTANGTVEVTTSTVVDVLMQYVGSDLRDIMTSAVQD